MAETRLDVNVTGTNDLAALTSRMQDFYAKTTQTSQALVNQKVQANAVKSIFRDHGVAVKNSANQILYYKDVLQKTAIVQNQFGQQATGATRQLKIFSSVGLQQVGYQVGDFAVQVQGGTNAMVALGQQGSQLLGIFGAGGAIAGALLAIGTAIANVYLQVNKVKDSADMTIPIGQFDKFKQAAEGVAEAIDKLTLARDTDITSGIVSDASIELLEREVAVREKLMKIEEARLSLEINAARQEINARQATIDALLDQDRIFKETALASATTDAERLQIQKTYQESFQKLIESNKELFLTQREQRAQLELAEIALEKLRKATEDEVEAAEGVVDGFNKAKDKILEAGEAFNSIDPQGFAADVLSSGEAFQVWVDELRKVKELIGEANYEALRLAGVDMSPGIRAAAAEALSLAERLNIAFMEAWNIANLANQASSIGLDAFGGAGDFQYSSPQTISAPKSKSGSSGSGATEEDPFQVLNDYIEAQMRQIEVERTLLTLGEEAARIKEIEYDLMEKLGDGYEEVGAAAVSAAAQEIAAAEKVNEALEEKREKMEEIQDVLSSGFEDFFMSIIDGSKTVGEAFADLAQYIVSELLRILVIKPLVDALAKSLGGIFGGLFATGGAFGVNGVMPYAKGGVFGSGGVTAFANGGVVSSPTIFPFANGVGLMGEAGPEAIMPLKRTPSGDLGVIAQGTGGGTPVNVVVNNYGKEEATVNQQPSGDIVVTVGKAVAQDIANGGATYQAMKKTFGLSQTVKRRG